MKLQLSNKVKLWSAISASILMILGIIFEGLSLGGVFTLDSKIGEIIGFTLMGLGAFLLFILVVIWLINSAVDVKENVNQNKQFESDVYRLIYAKFGGAYFKEHYGQHAFDVMVGVNRLEEKKAKKKAEEEAAIKKNFADAGLN